MRWLLALLAPFALLACSSEPRPADPALWRVDGPGGKRAWLFGTIHAAKQPLAWQTPTVRQALEQSDTIMVEVANLAEEAEVSATFARLAKSEGQPPLSRRVDSDERQALAMLLGKSGYRDSDFAAMDTWAAALILARAGASEEDARNGVDRAVIAEAGERPVVELEGAARQLGLFDALPEAEQRDLLGAVVLEASRSDADLAESWRTGDMEAIEKETRRGLLADPELREILFTGRNRAWTGKVTAAMKSGQTPFVAVGAAHMAGPQGLPAMLAARGYTVTRAE
ncbi:TraB/GumN family protein [Novosphingobium endophyticum]|uniref:TraB/GumN family protein n=1 Tax=Novosphingobium endophyticum TaxID=1955250 RepID=A0A916TRA9_9SPHN|nr:TraB/GumN family protein [Novosphingobium endophyticum]GGB97788.1 TraB/GumN family protein [Novosphingobium endophyticum]